MTEDTMAFLNAMQKRGGGDFLKELAEAVLQRLMDYDVEGRIGAGRYERSDERTTQRNGFLERSYDTRVGTLELKKARLEGRQACRFGCARGIESGHRPGL